MPLTKPLNSINEHDLEVLIAQKENESKSIEYKAALPLDVEKGKDEFRKDVTAFANSAGGDLVVGVDAPKGVPEAISGFNIGSLTPEQYTLRLTEIIQSRVKPRLQGIGIWPFELSNKK